MVKYEIGETVFRNCGVCGTETEHKVVESTYTDTNAYVCTECQQTDEELA